jgi:hypothetical protein
LEGILFINFGFNEGSHLVNFILFVFLVFLLMMDELLEGSWWLGIFINFWLEGALFHLFLF